ncbi:hypothetical protein [Melittangium boletus]|uniref:Lipoprotein n=1 Tax=Melittangium boletus DSM 14713 TaxID=1294270 RepID=A0A250IDR4_9BACT|nr:hypothetical protein [Melittangium boletus]ATB29350.1 hypothetical protein MEBOL_002799 [Melittangium boletus DSM 14713]
MRRLHPWAVLALSTLLTACYAMDSATSSCQHNPAYCTAVVGEETVVPTVRGGAEIASLNAIRQLLAPDTRARVERELVECAEWADTEVNRLRFGGNKPSRQQCQELLYVDPCGEKVTRAMQLGTEKHLLALQCTQEKLGALIPGRFSLEPRYRYDKQQGGRRLIPEHEARALLRRGCGEELRGTLRPDVVIHSGNPLEVQAVYDFKFPCPLNNEPSWKTYTEGPYKGSIQGDVYAESLESEAALIAPNWGVRQRVFP